jgi:muconate cycloisomerase
MSMSSLKIRGGEVFLVALPIRRPHHWVGHTARIGEGYVVLRLELENGIVGWGEAQVIGTWGGDHGARYGETPKLTATAITEILLPAISGHDVTEIGQLHARMDRVLRGYPYAKAAIDVALHDAIGKIYGVPVYQLLGGKVRDGAAIAHSIGIMDADAAAREAAEVIAEGVTTIKVKIGVEAERDTWWRRCGRRSAARERSASTPIRATGPGARPCARSPPWRNTISSMPSSRSKGCGPWHR